MRGGQSDYSRIPQDTQRVPNRGNCLFVHLYIYFLNFMFRNPLGNCNDLPDINIATFWSAAQSSAQEQSAGTMDYSARVATDKGKEVPKFLVPKTL